MSSWSATASPCSPTDPTTTATPRTAATYRARRSLAMKDVRLAAAFLSNGGGGSMPVNSNGASWNNDFITTTGNVVTDLLHNFHLECGARLHKLRVYETLSDPTGREVCGYLLVRGSVHAHAYALALKNITGVAIEKMLPTPNINLDKIPECQKYLAEGSHRRLYTFSPNDYKEIAGVWGNGEQALRRRSARGTRGGGRHARRRQDPPAHRHSLGLHPRLRAAGDVRDRDEALREVSLEGPPCEAAASSVSGSAPSPSLPRSTPVGREVDARTKSGHYDGRGSRRILRRAAGKPALGYIRRIAEPSQPSRLHLGQQGASTAKARRSRAIRTALTRRAKPRP